MLVLTRKNGQAIRLPGCDATIHVLKCANGKVSLGIEAPRDVKVIRDELKPIHMEEVKVA